LPEHRAADEQGEGAGKDTMHHVRKVLISKSHHVCCLVVPGAVNRVINMSGFHANGRCA